MTLVSSGSCALDMTCAARRMHGGPSAHHLASYIMPRTEAATRPVSMRREDASVHACKPALLLRWSGSAWGTCKVPVRAGLTAQPSPASPATVHASWQMRVRAPGRSRPRRRTVRARRVMKLASKRAK